MAAMLAGFKAATGDAVINISADLQDPVELIPQMVERWEGGAELVICFRASRSDPLFARFTSRVAYSVLRMALPQIPRGGFDCRAHGPGRDGHVQRHRRPASVLPGRSAVGRLPDELHPIPAAGADGRPVSVQLLETTQELHRRGPRRLVSPDPVHHGARRPHRWLRVLLGGDHRHQLRWLATAPSRAGHP